MSIYWLCVVQMAPPRLQQRLQRHATCQQVDRETCPHSTVLFHCTCAGLVSRILPSQVLKIPDLWLSGVCESFGSAVLIIIIPGGNHNNNHNDHNDHNDHNHNNHNNTNKALVVYPIRFTRLGALCGYSLKASLNAERWPKGFRTLENGYIMAT
jgi:hypothetical protein